VGKGKASVSNPSHSASDYVDWAEEIDFTGNGNAQVTDVAYDTKHNVVYFSKDQSFTCKNGATGDGQVLMAVYGKGNTLGKPPGSGWFVAELDQDECAVPSAGLYGCRFDANGNPTECGVVVVQEDDVAITPVPKSKGGGDR
jgi:hypothetical protein